MQASALAEAAEVENALDQGMNIDWLAMIVHVVERYDKKRENHAESDAKGARLLFSSDHNHLHLDLDRKPLEH